MAKISLIQFTPSSNNKESFSKIDRLIKDLSTDFIVLPEGAFSGCNENIFNNIERYAEEIPGEITAYLQKIAKQKQCCVISGIFEKQDSVFYNSIILVDSSGNIQKRSKTHIAPWVIENTIFSSGNNLNFFKTKFGPIATAICSELRSPVLLPIQNDLALSNKEEEIVFAFHISAWEKYPKKDKTDELNKTFEDRKKLLAARAIENRMYIFSVNSSGKNYGNSIIVNQWGEILEELNEEEGVSNYEVDLDEFKEKRKNFLPLRDLKLLKEYNKLLRN